MLSSCTICGLPLAVAGDEDDSSLCLDCLLANFSGQSVPDHWGPRPHQGPRVGALTPWEEEALASFQAHLARVERDG